MAKADFIKGYQVASYVGNKIKWHKMEYWSWEGKFRSTKVSILFDGNVYRFQVDDHVGDERFADLNLAMMGLATYLYERDGGES